MPDFDYPQETAAKTVVMGDVPRDRPQPLVDRVERLEAALQAALEQLDTHAQSLARVGERLSAVERHVGL